LSEVWLAQLQTTETTLEQQIAETTSQISTAEDAVFTAFCQQIGVADIHEYEESQLKLAQEEKGKVGV
jgi:structural maintenance of chromosome 1